jgi:hypothetical protein
MRLIFSSKLSSLQKLHYQVWASVVISQLEHRDDIGMLQAASGLSFAKEALQQFGLIRVGAAHHLDGD